MRNPSCVEARTIAPNLDRLRARTQLSPDLQRGSQDRLQAASPCQPPGTRLSLVTTAGKTRGGRIDERNNKDLGAAPMASERDRRWASADDHFGVHPVGCFAG